MLSVARAISKAVTGSTHLFFSCDSRFGETAGSDRLFMRSNAHVSSSYLLSVVPAKSDNG